MKPIVLNKYLDETTVNKILSLEENSTWELGKTLTGPDGTPELNRNSRIVNSIPVGPDWLLDLIFEIAEKHNEKYNIEYVSQCNLLRYDVGGKFEWHQDVVWKQTHTQRKLTMIIQLSDSSDYEGGRLEFRNFQIEDCKQKGTVILFPSNEKHKINIITKGKRYSLVSWINGPYCKPGPEWC